MVEASAALGLAQVQFRKDEAPAWFDSWLLLKAWWRLAILITLLVMAVTAIVTRFWMTKWYQAEALLAPSDHQPTFGVGSLDASGIAAQLGGVLNSRSTRLAEQYAEMLKSYAFTMSLVEDHQLGARILDEPREIKTLSLIDKWKLYGEMKRRFSCSYDIESDNISLYFIDPDPATAQMVLKF